MIVGWALADDSLNQDSGTRLLYISLLAAAIGIGTGLLVYVLYHLIALITNLVFYHRISFLFVSEVNTRIGALAIVMPVVGGILVGFMSKYGTSEIQGHGLPEALEAVIGALGVGVIGYFVPRIFGPGYDTIGAILENQFVLSFLLVILLFKFLALILSLGTRTSGGLLAPVFMIGAAVGGVFAILVNRIIPGANLSPGAFALVGMGAVFGASVRSTFAFIIFPLEITHNFISVLSLMIVGVVASGVAYVLYRNSVVTEKLARRGFLIPQDYEADIFKRVAVSGVMDPVVPTVRSDMKVRELWEKIRRGDAEATRHQALPIVDEKGQLVGIITHRDARRAVEKENAECTVLEAGSKELVLAFACEPLYEAVVRMLRQDIGRLPVVRRDDVHKVIGYPGRTQAISARLKKLAEDGIIPREVAEERLNRSKGSGNGKFPVHKEGREK